MEWPVTFEDIREVHTIARWEAANKYCLRIVLPSGQLVLQVGYPTTSLSCLSETTSAETLVSRRGPIRGGAAGAASPLIPTGRIAGINAGSVLTVGDRPPASVSRLFQ